MGENGTVWLPEGVSTHAAEIDSLFNFVNWVSLILFLGVVAAMLYFVYRYRRRSAGDRPEPVEPNTLIEASWVVVPTILVLIVFNWGFKAYINLSTAPPDAYEIRVQAAMWKWDFEYPNGKTSTGELHVPMDRPVRLIMTSQDVLHSFFVPVFRVKQDLVPNRYSSVWFEATKAGEYQIFCTEYCGTQHSGMLAKVVVEDQGAFNEWLDEVEGEGIPLPQLGERLYTQQACNTCHSLDGSRKVGPSFQGLFGSQEQLTDGSSVLVDEDYLRESIVQPNAKVVEGYQPVMPPYAGLNERQLAGLIEFIKAQQ